MKSLTSKQRLNKAIGNGIPDRLPVTTHHVMPYFLDTFMDGISVQEFFDYFTAGDAYHYWAVWPRNDYLSHPECCPPSHGTCYYAETDWLWNKPEGAHPLGMFPNLVDLDRLMDPPPDNWLGRA